MHDEVSNTTEQYTLATEISAQTVYSEKVEHPMKWKMSFPLHLNRVIPSGINPLLYKEYFNVIFCISIDEEILTCVARIFTHKFVLGDLQNLQS